MAPRTNPGKGHRGILAREVAQATLEGLKKNEYQIVVGEAKGLVEGAGSDFEKVFERLNSWQGPSRRVEDGLA